MSEMKIINNFTCRFHSQLSPLFSSDCVVPSVVDVSQFISSLERFQINFRALPIATWMEAHLNSDQSCE